MLGWLRSSRAVGRFLANPLAVAGLVLYLSLLLVGLVAPWIAPHDFALTDLPSRLEGPSWSHPFGRDELGRDLLSRVLLGARVSLRVGLIVTSISGCIGVSIGLLAGWWGGWFEEIVMRLTDILLAFPGLLLAIALVALLGPGIDNVILAMCLTGWVGFARLTRGQVLQAREFEFIQAAIALGAPTPRILLRHVLPAISAPLIVEVTFGMAAAILGEASLSFLGLGVQPPTPSWGSILNSGKDFLSYPHMTIFAGLAIMLSVLGLNFLGDGLRDALDPKA